MPLNLKIKSLIICLMVSFGFAGVVFGEGAGTFTGQINADGINVRVDSTVGAQVICTLAKGELVEVSGGVYDWYKIRLPKEAPAYIRKDL
ncbi:MAG TPA: SH3 domain-containing protein, partial [Candidatus Omnitrophota bacterium]|nr:SH3 domain-containing protein [Candidatus Omnitrophota bacterium]